MRLGPLLWANVQVPNLASPVGLGVCVGGWQETPKASGNVLLLHHHRALSHRAASCREDTDPALWNAQKLIGP